MAVQKILLDVTVQFPINYIQFSCDWRTNNWIKMIGKNLPSIGHLLMIKFKLLNISIPVQLKIYLHYIYVESLTISFFIVFLGPSSYKEHGYRLLMIWTSNLSADIMIVRELYDALCAIDKKNVAGNY